MNILIISNGNGLSDVKSGGVTRNIEILKNKPPSFEITINCTSGLKKLYTDENVKCRFVLNRCSFWKKNETSVLDRLIAYVISTFYSFYNVIRIKEVGMVIAPSDYIFDIFPACAYKLINYKKTKFICTLHHICQSPFARNGNPFINTISYIMQRLSYFMISATADGVVVYDTYVGKEIACKLKSYGYRGKIHYTYNGVDLNRINQIKPNAIKWDATFAGGLRATKGVFDLCPIWRGVVDKFPTSTLLVMGHGTKSVENQLREQIKYYCLEQNIKLIGSVDFDSMIENIKSSKMFISTSHEEGWGISVCEAIACNVDVLVYNLEVFEIFGMSVKKIPFGNHQEYTYQILKTLENPTTDSNKSIFLNKYTWPQIANDEYTFYESII